MPAAPRFLAFALVAVAVAAGFAAWRPRATEIATPVDLATVPYATSAACVMCHPQHYQSWHRTFHRTMTQVAGPDAVLGNFENATLTHDGVTSRFTREGERYIIETLAPEGGLERYEVAMTIGSRRLQQYVTWTGRRHVRLPLAWNIEEGRWIHLSGAFLHPDGSEFNTHRADWDNNCIFCHNVKARPRLDEAADVFDPRVAEMGIACEACHGPASEHVKRNSDPLRRYLLYAGDRDPTVQSPEEMTPARQIQVCGHCHGQRLPNPRGRIAEFLLVGDPYTAGDDLDRFTTPIDVHTELPGVDLSLRFWKDGTPRLTAHEYQGLLGSAGHEATDLTCTSCHSMHGGDPRGMIREEMRGREGCLQCHDGIARDIPGHTRHAADGTGSDCYGCHMPPTTYGLLEVHPSHRIASPDPARAWRHDMPEACTLCHTNRTAAWAASEASRQYGHPAPTDPPDAGGFEWAENVRAAFAGDVVQRAVAVEAFAREASYTPAAAARLWVAPLLLLSMEDRYPAVRFMAYRGLSNLCRRARAEVPGVEPALNLPRFDYLAESPARAAVIAKWWSWWRDLDKRSVPHPGPAVPLDPDLMPVRSVISSLTAKQNSNVIAIGE